MTADRIDQSTVFAPLGYIRTVTVDVVIKAKAAAGVDDVLDDLCAEVEPLMVDVPGIEDQLEFVGNNHGPVAIARAALRRGSHDLPDPLPNRRR